MTDLPLIMELRMKVRVSLGDFFNENIPRKNNTLA